MSETIGQFDTHKLMRAMVEGGIPQQHAELIIDSQITIVRGSDLATRRDLEDTALAARQDLADTAHAIRQELADTALVIRQELAEAVEKLTDRMDRIYYRLMFLIIGLFGAQAALMLSIILRGTN